MLTFGMLVSMFFVDAASGQLPVIELGAVSPTAAKAGSEVEMKVSSGNRKDEVDQLRFSHPGITATVMTEDPLPFTENRRQRFGHFKVKVANEVPPGKYEVRAVGRHGISNPRTFVVHRFSETQLSASHDRIAPTKLPLATVIHSKVTASEIDYYQIEVTAGQKIRIDLHAADLDSRMIGLLELFDSSGRVIQTAHGTDEVDPQLVIDADQDQTLVVAVSDAIFRGGEEYGYLLFAQQGENPKSLVGDDVSRKRFTRLVGDYSGLIKDAIKIDETSDAKQITLPCKITAEFDSRDDIDRYEFSANEGDQYTIDLVSQRLGQPTDARILVERSEAQQAGDPKWVQVAVEDDSYNISDAVMRLSTHDPVLSFKAPKSTTYRLTVRDLDTGTTLSKKQRYWIDIRKPKPSVDLITYASYPHRDPKQARNRGSHLFRLGVETLRVFAIRRDGWKGPIELSIEGLPQGVRSPVVTMAADRNEVQMTLAASESAPHSIASLKVIGKVTIDGKETKIQSQFATTQWGRGGQRDFHRLRKSDDLLIAVSERDLSSIAVSVGDGKTHDLKKGGELKLPIKLTRQESAKNDCVVRPRDLPPNVTAGEVKISKDKSDGELVFKAKDNANPGTYSLWLQCETKIKHKANPQALQRAKAYRDQLQKLHDDPANKDKLESIKAAIKTADAQVESAKGNAKDQDLTVFLPSPSITIRVVQ